VSTQNAEYEPGTRVRWWFTDHKGGRGEVVGTIVGEGPHGRIEVRDDDGGLHHIQPSWVQIDDSGAPEEDQ